MNDIIQGQLSEALARMNEALRILDGMGAPGDIGGHLDLAIARLEERVGVKTPVPDSFGDDRSPTVKEGSFDADLAGDATCAWDGASI